MKFSFAMPIVILLCGCAVKAAPTKLAISHNSISAKCYGAAQTVLGVAPAFDDRPVPEKEGSKAKGLYLLLWNQRRGSYTSSDRDLGGDVSGSITNLVKETIENTNCVRDVKILSSEFPIQPRPENLLVAFVQDQAKYVLTIQIKHLYGQQDQDTKLVVLPAYFVNAASWGNQVGAASGWAEVLFTLYDSNTGAEVWRENIQETASAAEKGTYAQVAHEATSKLLQTFASKFEQNAKTNLQAS